MRDEDERELEGLFRAARALSPAPSGALMARVLADAEAARPRPAPDPTPVSGVAAPSWIAQLLGGWRGLGGLATAGAAGLWIGYAGLADTALMQGGLIDAEAAVTVDLMPSAEGVTLLAGAGG
ncbi:MAG: dihydroorotate dehydrogenase [Rhodobacteraceae bacterium]|nr:dihydroorotate dehydrogenase [Paracoccaceae bacterium]